MKALGIYGLLVKIPLVDIDVIVHGLVRETVEVCLGHYPRVQNIGDVRRELFIPQGV